jgi:FlaA1/EpsC-like NDP-sugar epimerase
MPVLTGSRQVRRAIAFGADLVLVPATLWLILRLRYRDFPLVGWEFWEVAATAMIAAWLVFIPLGLYRSLIRALAESVAYILVAGFALSAIALMALHAVPVDVAFNYAVLGIAALAGFRVGIRHLYSRLKSIHARPVLIYGAGESGRQIASIMLGSAEYRPIAFIDDSPSLRGAFVNGLVVRGPEAIPRLVERHEIGTVVLAMPSVPRIRRREIIRSLVPLKLSVRSLPDISDLVAGRAQLEDLRNIDIADVLGRDPVAAEPHLLARNLQQKAVMVTGAGGSIGSELCRQIIRQQPTVLVLVEVSEIALYRIESELRTLREKQGLSTEIVALLGDVREADRLESIMTLYRIESIFHAAAYKHVPIVEENVIEGVENNILGTWGLAEAAARAGVQVFVLISTDKAVNPTNVMGATKRAAELVLQAMQQRYPAVTFSMVRFGNVLGSSGSVVPLFEEQIRRGGPVTVTHPDVVRYFMTIPEAAQLVIQAGAMAEGGDVFVLDMGPPVKIVDLARKMIELAGFSVKDGGVNSEGIEIAFTGLRPGEKLYEELLIGSNVSGTQHPMIMRAMEHAWSWEQLQPQLLRMREMVGRLEGAGLVAALKQCVTEYTPSAEIHDLLYAAQQRLGPTARQFLTADADSSAGPTSS